MRTNISKIPAGLTDRIKKIERLISRKQINVNRKIAVFDLDNTLIIGDIGEAVFAALKNREKRGFLTVKQKKMPLSWSEYQRLLKKK